MLVHQAIETVPVQFPPSVHYLKISVLKRNPLQTDARHTSPAESTNDLLKRRLLPKTAAYPPRILPHPPGELRGARQNQLWAGRLDQSDGLAKAFCFIEMMRGEHNRQAQLLEKLYGSPRSCLASKSSPAVGFHLAQGCLVNGRGQLLC